MGLSAVVITYNEESNIDCCLQALSFADEIIVLDSGSTDKTVEIARKYTDKVSTRPFTGFSDQKNAAVQLAGSEWVLIVDADEVITEELASEICIAINGSYDAYKIPRLTYFLCKPIRYCGWYPDFQLRLVKKQLAVFSDRLVHESLDVMDNCGVLKRDMIHNSFPSLDDYVRKTEHYARLSARQKLRDGRRFRIADLIIAPGATFLKKYILQMGFLDGLRGLIISVTTAYGVFLRYAMLWELTSQSANERK